MPVNRLLLRETLELELGHGLDALDGWCDQIDQAWPAMPLDPVAFARALAVVARKADDLEGSDVADFYLAQACVAGAPAAHQALDALLAQLATGLRRQASDDEVSETLQRLRERLLIGTTTGPARLSLFAARGPLLGFLRVTAVNVLRNLRARNPAELESDDGLAALPDGADLESGLLRADQQQHFREAFRAAVQSLTARERSLLRLNLLDGLSIDELAPMYRAHRSSVARWLADARATLAVRTRALLAKHLGLPPEELESLLTSVQNQFELSLSRALRETTRNDIP